jgi:hypothetical protein
MQSDLWGQFRALAEWQQALLSGATLIALGAVGRAAMGLLRRRGKTLYVMDAAGHVVGGEPPPDSSAGESAESSTDAAAAEPSADDSAELSPDDAEDTASGAPDWADGRPLCPCCGYPAMVDIDMPCVLCDWDEEEFPESEAEHSGVLLATPLIHVDSSAEREEALALARKNFATFGSAASPQEREEDGADPLTTHQIELRRKLRERFDYLKGGDRPDTSETWDTIDDLIKQLREEIK